MRLAVPLVICAGVGCGSSPAEVEKHRSGKKNLTGFFVGAVMKELRGKGNPAVVNALLKKKLDGGS